MCVVCVRWRHPAAPQKRRRLHLDRRQILPGSRASAMLHSCPAAVLQHLPKNVIEMARHGGEGVLLAAEHLQNKGLGGTKRRHRAGIRVRPQRVSCASARHFPPLLSLDTKPWHRAPSLASKRSPLWRFGGTYPILLKSIVRENGNLKGGLDQTIDYTEKRTRLQRPTERFNPRRREHVERPIRCTSTYTETARSCLNGRSFPHVDPAKMVHICGGSPGDLVRKSAKCVDADGAEGGGTRIQY